MVIAILGTIVILELLAISWLIRQGGRAPPASLTGT